MGADINFAMIEFVIETYIRDSVEQEEYNRTLVSQICRSASFNLARAGVDFVQAMRAMNGGLLEGALVAYRERLHLLN